MGDLPKINWISEASTVEGLNSHWDHSYRIFGKVAISIESAWISFSLLIFYLQVPQHAQVTRSQNQEPALFILHHTTTWCVVQNRVPKLHWSSWVYFSIYTCPIKFARLLISDSPMLPASEPPNIHPSIQPPKHPTSRPKLHPPEVVGKSGLTF